MVDNAPQPPAPAPTPAPQLLWLALALSVGAAISLGVTRFSYGLLLPPMREDLGWSYLLAGSMNTVNALGYLVGALAMPALLKRFDPTQLLLHGALLASLFMALSGFFVAAPALLLQRLLAGAASALVFVAGGLLAAGLAAQQPQRSGLLLGLYYGGAGFGIVVSALLVPEVLDAMQGHPHAWTWAWWALSLACGLGSALLVWPARVLRGPATAPVATAGASSPSSNTATGPVGGDAAATVRRFEWRDFSFSLVSYFLFGVGYIGYMTFVIALIRQQGASAQAVTLFYSLLGVAVVLSARLWARLLDHFKGGQALAILSLLLGIATVIPAWTSAQSAVLFSGLLFGAVMLSLVASTTALVRHNLPQASWAAGISRFTVVFAAGQIVGPTVTGWISDGPGGLERGLVFSAAALWLGAVLAWRQRALS